jgi:prepilin-type N-terminal cleavage/methylation domain-containing protein
MIRSAAARRRAFTLIELVIVVGISALLISVLLPIVSHVRKTALSAQLASSSRYGTGGEPAAPAARADLIQSVSGSPGDKEPRRQPDLPLALVKTFAAKVELTPRLSVGTAEPESIYEARFTATLEASAPTNASRKDAQCEIRLPLPPQIISLADLSVTVNKEPSDNVALRDSTLVWTGALPSTPTPITVTYAAVGKGLYELQTPPGRILDTFNLDLVANGSDVRMLELSLQPTKLTRGAGQTTYTWNYTRLMFGRPIAVDVLGVAPVDRLGELRWLGPLSVVIFGLIVGLYAHAHLLVNFDRWMLLLTLGAFTGVYPLMYFAQEFMPLRAAILGAAGVVLVVIALRTWTIIGARHALLGVVLPAAATMAVTLVVATNPGLQGILLTAASIAVFVVMMVLIPRLKLPGFGEMGARVQAV